MEKDMDSFKSLEHRPDFRPSSSLPYVLNKNVFQKSFKLLSLESSRNVKNTLYSSDVCIYIHPVQYIVF